MAADSGMEDSLFGVILQDSYKITGLLGQGGMGAVYDAVQIRLNKRVAIKVMARELATNSEALNRFHREAMITSGLGHPHIVQVFDFATTPTGQPFLAMEFLDGEDLDRRLARIGRLSPEQTTRLVKQVASALSATHAQQIVHRDLKPANIYLLKVAGEDDFVKVLDFGISKILVANNKITKATALIGTPDYMSPEQALGGSDEVDHRTDQWALACIAWECLTGKSPFVAETIPAMLFQVVHGTPAALASRVAGLPEGIEPVLRRALAKKKDERYPGVVEFAQALEAAVVGRLSESGAVQLPMASQTSISASVKAPLQGQGSGSRSLRTASQMKVETAAYDVAPAEERSERPTTTFSHAAGETEDSHDEARAPRPKWQWAAMGAGAAVLSLTMFLVLRPGSNKHARVKADSSATAPAAVTPTPAVAPAPAPAAPVPAPAAPIAPPAPAAAPAATPPVGEVKADSVEPSADSKAPEDLKLHKKGIPSGRAKAKTAAPEHRLIKEL